MERNQKKPKSILPKREDDEYRPSRSPIAAESHEVKTDYFMTYQWDEKPSLSNKVNVNIILPNFRVKGRNVYFIMEPDMWVVLDKIYLEDELLIESEGYLVSVQYLIYTEEDSRGLRCKVMINGSDLYYGDYQFIGKLVELNILGVNPEKKYQLMDFRQELAKKKKMKKIPQIQNEIAEKSSKRIIPIED